MTKRKFNNPIPEYQDVKLVSSHAQPIALSICQESRKEALLKYHVSFSVVSFRESGFRVAGYAALGIPRFHFSSADDIFLLDPAMINVNFNLLAEEKGSIRHLAIREYTLTGRNGIWSGRALSICQAFPNLETLTVLPGPPERTRFQDDNQCKAIESNLEHLWANYLDLFGIQGGSGIRVLKMKILKYRDTDLHTRELLWRFVASRGTSWIGYQFLNPNRRPLGDISKEAWLQEVELDEKFRIQRRKCKGRSFFARKLGSKRMQNRGIVRYRKKYGDVEIVASRTVEFVRRPNKRKVDGELHGGGLLAL